MKLKKVKQLACLTAAIALLACGCGQGPAAGDSSGGIAPSSKEAGASDITSP